MICFANVTLRQVSKDYSPCQPEFSLLCRILVLSGMLLHFLLGGLYYNLVPEHVQQVVLRSVNILISSTALSPQRTKRTLVLLTQATLSGNCCAGQGNRH